MSGVEKLTVISVSNDTPVTVTIKEETDYLVWDTTYNQMGMLTSKGRQAGVTIGLLSSPQNEGGSLKAKKVSATSIQFISANYFGTNTSGGTLHLYSLW